MRDMDRISSSPSTSSGVLAQAPREAGPTRQETPRIEFQRLSPEQRAKLSNYSLRAFGSIGELRGMGGLGGLPPLEPCTPPDNRDQDWLQQQLRVSPEALEAYQKLSPEQRQSFLRVALAATPQDQPLSFSLMNLLQEGKLGSKDQKGETLLSNLEKLAGQKTAKGFSPKALLASALAQLGSAHGGNGTVDRLALERPAEYVRLLRGLASPEGEVEMAGGKTLKRPQELLPVGPFGSAADQIMRSSFQQLADGKKLPEGKARREVLLEALKKDGEAYQAFQKLKPEQQEQFLKLLDSDGFQKERQVSADNCMEPPAPNPALLQLLKSGKLLSKDSKGTTLLDNLQRLSELEPPKGMTRESVLSEVLSTLTTPPFVGLMGGGNAGPMGKLSQEQPSEYVRLALGLLGPEGKVELANGETMELVVPKSRGLGMLGGLGRTPGVKERLNASLEAHLDKSGSSQKTLDSVKKALEAHPKALEAFNKLTPEQQEQFLNLALRSPTGRFRRAQEALGTTTDQVTLNPDLLKLLESGTLTQQAADKSTVLENLGKIGSDRRLEEALGLLADPSRAGGWQVGGLEQLLRRDPAEFARRVGQLSDKDSHSPLVDQLREKELGQFIEQKKEFDFTNSVGQTFKAQITEMEAPDGKRKFTVRLGEHSLVLTVPKDENVEKLVGKVLDYWSQQPEHLRGELKSFRVEPGRNPDDAYWEEKYKIPGFTSAATAGGHEITLWNGGGYFDKGLFDHEFGHLVGQKDDDPLRGDTDFCPPGWEDAIKADNQSVSDYGDKAIAEDFAEAWKHYLKARSEGDRALREFRLKYPNRVKILDKIWENRDQLGPQGILGLDPEALRRLLGN